MGAGLKTAANSVSLNKWAIVVGLVLFIVASGMIFSPRIISQTTIVWPLFLACAALGVVMAAIGTEAKVAGPGSTIAGAGAIAIILFLVLIKAIGDVAPRYRGSLLVRGADPKTTLELMDPRAGKNPVQAAIVYKTDSTDGVIRDASRLTVFDFTLDATSAIHLNDENCPSLFIEFADGRKRILRFAKSKIIPADYSNFFQLEFIVDKDKLYYDNGPSSNESKSCDASAEQIVSEETNTQTSPPTGPTHEKAVSEQGAPKTSAEAIPAPIETEPQHPAAAPRPTTAAQNISQSPNNMLSPTAKVAGYVIVAQLSPDFKTVKKTWFDIDGKPNARFPSPNDVLTSNRDHVPIYPAPYHWDAASQKHIVPTSFAKMAIGQKAKVGADVFLARDENTGARYVIAPIIEFVGSSLPADKPLYPAIELPPEIKGYAYLGYLDSDGATYVSKTFDNFTNPAALYPSPGDILEATSNVWLRGGPRRWDAGKQDYVNAPTVAPLKQGQYVQVGGDTFLAKGGLSVWVPISKVYSGGLMEVAKQAEAKP